MNCERCMVATERRFCKACRELNRQEWRRLFDAFGHEDLTRAEMADYFAAYERPPRDLCQSCMGRKGGIPGNEVIYRGKVVCDYCHMALAEQDSGRTQE